MARTLLTDIARNPIQNLQHTHAHFVGKATEKDDDPDISLLGHGDTFDDDNDPVFTPKQISIMKSTRWIYLKRISMGQKTDLNKTLEDFSDKLSRKSRSVTKIQDQLGAIDLETDSVTNLLNQDIVPTLVTDEDLIDTLSSSFMIKQILRMSEEAIGEDILKKPLSDQLQNLAAVFL